MKKRSLLALLAFCAFAPAAFAGVEQTVSELLPKLAAAQVEDRYGAQMELQQLAAHAARPGAEAERAELAKILAAKATDPTVPQPARVWIVRQIEYIGAAESVPALTTLLKGQDAELKECARRALEKNPAPAVTETLRKALAESWDTHLTPGLIQALGERRDSESVHIIMSQMAKTHLVTKIVADAALSALGKIADPKAIAFLQMYYDTNPSDVGNALVIAGNRLLSTGDKAGAKDVFGKLYLAGTPAQAGGDSERAKLPAAPIQVRSAALIGWAAADPESVRPVIAAALQQSQPKLQFAAVSAATVAFGEAGVTDALAPLLSKLAPTAKTYVLRVLSASAEKQIIAAAGDADETVRVAALERLGQVGSAASIPVLFQAATASSSSAQKTAVAALARISGPGAGPAITKLAEQGEPKSRAVAIKALAQRDDQAASPALLAYAGESDPEVSAAACAALARLGTDNELEGLVQLVLAGKTPGAPAALQAVATRAHDKAAAAQRIIALTQTAAPQQLAPLFDILVLLGGKEALTAVSMSAGSSNEQVKDAAIRALANWPDFPATQPLLVIAADLHTKRVHNVLAVQAVARLVKTSDQEPAAARLKAALAAMNLAARDEEKKLVLSALASVPDRKAAEALKPFLGVPKYQQEAGLAAVTLAEALRKTDKPAAKDLAQAVKNAGISDDISRKADAILKKN